MKYSEVLESILKRASERQPVSAPAILTAVAELCATEYRGITPYRDEYYPEWYEEERLRYLFRKLFRASGNLVAYSLKRKLQKESLDYDVDFMEVYAKQMEHIMTTREKVVLSADIVFLSALASIQNRQLMGLNPQYQSALCVEEMLADVDKNIYDFVIVEIGKIQSRLQKKADEARAKRDWKPAEKYLWYPTFLKREN